MQNTYFRKDYKLMIHNIVLDDELRARYKSKKCADERQVKIHESIAINQVLQISVLDVVNSQAEELDNQISLDLSNFINGKSNDVATVKFDLNKQKILAPTSTNFFTIKLQNSLQDQKFCGTIQYKFVGMKKKQITEQQFKLLQSKREQVQKKDQILSEHQQMKRMKEILQERNSVVLDQLNTNQHLILQIRKLNEDLIRDTNQKRTGSRGKDKINFNVNINATTHEKMINQNKGLIDQNFNLRAQIDKLQLDVQALQAEVKFYKDQSALYKKELHRKEDQPSIFINQPSYRIQNTQNQEKQLQNRSKMADSIYEGNTPQNNDRRRKTSFFKNPSQQLLDSSALRRNRRNTFVDTSRLSTLQVNESLSKQIQNIKNSITFDDPNRNNKIQINLRNAYKIIQRFTADKQILDNTILIKNQQILQLKSEINRQIMQIKSLQKIVREKSTTAKHEFDQRTTAIRLQAQMKMVQIRRNKRFQNYDNIQKQQRLELMFQGLKYQVQTSKQQNATLRAEIQSLKAEKQSLQKTHNATQISTQKQKQMYKSKYHQISQSFLKKQEQLSSIKDKASQYEAHLERIHQLEQVYEEIQKKLQKQTKQKDDFQRTAKRYQDKLQSIQQEWKNLRTLQVDYDTINRKYQSILKVNEKFQLQLQQMRKFATKLQTSYYQKRQKQQSEKQFNEKYNSDMQARLGQTYSRMNKFEKQFYEDMMTQLANQRKQCVEHCYMKIKRQSQIIDDNQKIQEKKKSLNKSELQKFLNKQKDQQLQTIQKKIRHYQLLYKKAIEQEGYVPKTLSQKVAYIQQKVKSFQQGQLGYVSKEQSLKMKETIQKLSQSLKQREVQCDQLKKSVGKRSFLDSSMYSGNYLESNQRKIMLDEMTKSRQIYTKSFQDMKKHNSQLMKAKSVLQIEAQNSKFRQQKLILKHQERERELERVAKKSNDQNLRKINQLTRNLQKRSDEVIKLTHQREQLKQNLSNCIAELNSLGEILQKMQKQNLLLQDQNQEHKVRIQRYEQAQKVILKQVQNIKKQAEFNEKQFRVLLQERNESFLKIQKIKDCQIEKLKIFIVQIQTKLQSEIGQVLGLKREIQANNQTINTLSSQLDQTKTNYEVTNQNYQKDVEDTVLKINTLQQQNDQLQNNLLEYAQKLRQAEFTIAESQIKLDSYKMQIEALQHLKKEMFQLQEKFKKEKKNYQDIIEQQTEKLKQIQDKYESMESVVMKQQRQNQEVRIQNFKLTQQVQELRMKYQKKADDLITLKNDKSDIQIQLKEAISRQHSLVNKINELTETINGMGLHIQDLTQHINQLSAAEENYKNNLLTINAPKNQEMRISNVAKFDKSRVKQDMAGSRMKISTAKQMQKSVKFNQNNLKNKFSISQAQSLRGTQIKDSLDQNEHEQKHLPNITIPKQILRQRMFTLHEQEEEQNDHGSGNLNNKSPNQRSSVNIYIDQMDSDELESEMSARQKQFQTFNPKKQERQSGQMSQSYANQQPKWRNAQSQSQSFINVKQFQDKIKQLESENLRLKEQLSIKTVQIDDSKRQNLLKSALGLTSGILLNQRKRSQQIRIQDRQSNITPSRSQSPHYSSKQSSPQVSRQASIHNVPQNLNDKSQLQITSTNLNMQKKSSIARSSVQVVKQRRGSRDSNRHEYRDIEQRNRDLQLQFQQMLIQNQQLRNIYQEQKQNVDKLYNQLEKQTQIQEQLKKQIQMKQSEASQLQTYFNDIKSQLQAKLQELIEQQLQKDTSQLNALKQLNQKQQTIKSLQKKIIKLQQFSIKQKERFIQKQNQIEKMKEQYRKYEEDSELQILNLKQLCDLHIIEIQEKTKQVELIAQDYFQLKEQIKLLEIDSMNKDALIQKYRNSSEQTKDQLNRTFDDYKNLQDNRKSLNSKHLKLQQQLAIKQDEISQISKKSIMTIKKFQIRIQAFQQQKLTLQQKLSQKDHMNQSLKQQIALYNSQTYELKKLNSDLTSQIQQTQKQLKDIMYSYQQEFASVSHDKRQTDESLSNYKKLSKEKDQQVNSLIRKIKKLQEDQRFAQHQTMEVKQNYEEYKISKQKEINQHYMELQIKTDQYEKLKKIHERQSEQFFTKQSQYLVNIQNFTKSSKQYKQKLKKYQQTLQQLQAQLIKLSQRPTKQQFQELSFQSQLFKNRIQQLQQHLKDSVNNYNHQQQYYNQFRKYKTLKQRQLNDLQNQLQKYSTKFNEFEQNNYHLKKQIQKLRHEIQKLVQERDMILDENYELKEDLEEIKSQMEFYKGRRIQNLSKLLNDTM